MWLFLGAVFHGDGNKLLDNCITARHRVTMITMIRLYDFYELIIVFCIHLLVAQKWPPTFWCNVFTPEIAVASMWQCLYFAFFVELSVHCPVFGLGLLEIAAVVSPMLLK